MQKKSKKGFHLYAYQKVILSYVITLSICAWVLYPLMHRILNYPPGTVDTQFQIEYGGLSYTAQFVSLYIVVVSLFVIYQRFFLFKKIANWEQKGTHGSKYSVEEIRKTLLVAPTKFYLLQIIIPFIAITIGLGMPIVKHELESSGITVAILWVSILTFNATISYVFSKNLFKPILISTFKENRLPIKKHSKLSNDMILLLLPLLVAGLFFTVIVSYCRLVNVRGNDFYEYYKNELNYNFGDNTYYTDDELMDKLSDLEYIDSTHSYFIIDSDKNIITSDGVPLTDFFQKYMYELSDQYGGRVYEHYAVNTQGYIKHISNNGEDYIIGVRFPISGEDALVYIITTFVVLFGIISFLVWYYSSSLSSQIKIIVNGLNDINTKNNEEFKKIPVISNDELGELTVAFNKIQDLTEKNISQIHDNQQILMERERLASLGQLVGGIAHNLKTPIMSISGAAEGLTDLIKEYDSSIDDPEVNSQDHHEIAHDMSVWVDKIKEYSEYMSDVISAVKGQAVVMSETDDVDFDVEELVKRIDILMKHELKNALVYLNISLQVPEYTKLKGDINSLVQVINNMISNSIQAYDGKPNQNIDLIIYQDDINHLVISIKDYGPGLPDKVKDKLFTEMITTKGKNGTGLGLYMSYSTIRGHFGGDITFETKKGKGTTFNILLPISK